MSMRLYSEQGFFKELEKFGFTKTDVVSSNAVVLERDGEKFVVRRGRDNYPDYLIDELLRHANKDGEYIEGGKATYFKVEEKEAQK